MTKTLRAAAVAAGFCAIPLLAWGAGAPTPCGEAKAAAWPTFCSIPATPTDVRPPEKYKTTVVDTRLAGRRLIQATGPDTFGLPIGGADAFAASARAEVTPPSPMPTSTSAAANAAFLEEARKEVTPPPRHRRPSPETPAKP